MTDREKLVELINNVCEGHVENLMQPYGAEIFADYLLANGVMELVRNHGEWISVELNRSFGSFAGIRCSLCDFEKIKSPLVKAPNYCENCGAKMEVIFEENN